MDIVKTRLNKVDDYRKSILATIAFDKLLNEWDIGYELIKGSTFNNDGSLLTPDLLLKSKRDDKQDLIGDIKKSLPNPRRSSNISGNISEWKDSEQAKNFAKNEMNALTDLKKYSHEFKNVNPSNVFAFYKRSCEKSVEIWRRHADNFDEFIGISYDIRSKSGSGEKAIDISHQKLENTAFEDSELQDYFKYGKTEWLYNSAPKLIGESQTALVEESHNAPKEHIMLILWMNVFSEIKNGSSTEEILERMKLEERGEAYYIEATLNDIQEHLKNKYSSKHYYDEEDHLSEESQISRGKIKEAMNNFSQIDKTEVEIIRSGNNPKYKITYEPITRSGDAMGEIIKSLDNEDLLERTDGTLNVDNEQKRLDAIIKKDINKG